MLEAKVSRLGLLLILLLGLAACVPNQTDSRRFSIIVQNQCTGANKTVYLYVNNQYWGTVQGSRIIPDMPPGGYNLRAVGTANGAQTFTRRIELQKDVVWTLCL